MHDKHTLTQVLSSQSPAWMLENKLSGSHICLCSYSIPRGRWDPSIRGCIYLCLNFRVSISTPFWSKTFPLSCDIWGTFSWRADLQGPHFLHLSPKVMWTRTAEHCITTMGNLRRQRRKREAMCWTFSDYPCPQVVPPALSGKHRDS